MAACQPGNHQRETFLKDTLILTFNAPTTDLKAKVYQHTLSYIGKHLEKAEQHVFSNSEALLILLNKGHFSAVITTNEIPSEVAFLVKGLGLVQVVMGYRKDLAKAADIIIDPLINNSEKYLVGPRFLLPSILSAFPLKDLAAMLEMSEEDLKEKVACNEAEAELLDISRLYRKLAWDSEFFGINVGYISCLRLTSNSERHISKFLRREKIDVVEYLCNCHDRESVLVSEQNGYSFVDMRLTFERPLHEPVMTALRANLVMRKANIGDVPVLKCIGTDIYKHSRYYFDDNFSQEKVIEFYQGWIEKAVLGQFDDFAYVLCDGQGPIGFCTVKKIGRHSARFGLVGVDSKRSGEGLAKILIDNALVKLQQEEAVGHIEVVTQGRNYAAQRLYQRCGFVTKKTELWYHKWFL